MLGRWRGKRLSCVNLTPAAISHCSCFYFPENRIFQVHNLVKDRYKDLLFGTDSSKKNLERLQSKPVGTV